MFDSWCCRNFPSVGLARTHALERPQEWNEGAVTTEHNTIGQFMEVAGRETPFRKAIKLIHTHSLARTVTHSYSVLERRRL